MDANPQSPGQPAAGQETGRTQAGKQGGTEITPELVSQVADRIWKMLLLEMKVEKERYRRQVKSPRFPRGGW